MLKFQNEYYLSVLKILPGLRINTVKIMYGALLISYIAFSGSKTSVTAANEITPSVRNMTYTVKPGDTLSSIAVRYGVSIDAIKKANNLRSSLVTIGENLVIPTAINQSVRAVSTSNRPFAPNQITAFVSTPTHFTESAGSYTIKVGDTLYSIGRNNARSSIDDRTAAIIRPEVERKIGQLPIQ